jgi:hypothetical protein
MMTTPLLPRPRLPLVLLSRHSRLVAERVLLRLPMMILLVVAKGGNRLLALIGDSAEVFMVKVVLMVMVVQVQVR